MSVLPQEGFVRMKQLTHVLGMSRGTVYNRIHAGQFPAPSKDGRISLWRVEDVRAYINQKKDGGSVLPAVGQDNPPTPAS